mmetsp:Transcript_33919/g.61235  ORF Transcript_33919/g.61235 Transcript_33919/m.61235 type:complete len:234 (-) Transcript_33919:288-989(-)|eukprot:CAMPEP_0175058474 /NCGR_PEP_ID=MMETSP0052_2-20121109/11867_1 /TAXON_ID=51329 ORGANISM="Polytomella parva, Strain SAG 63-3" /NCGR_SAMPLE_ID=MMETSP0052_2 /ASSEMBLY_ACC=CAM_ASM_000194 /LENGTH=233 /DNA_ID=CAMNT_0016323857 /DNA_START=59 /DNA_END=760 /DNA_ORIENTATION=+
MAPTWIPLESNPDVLMSYANNLGLRGAGFYDVFGLDEELLAMVPPKVFGLILCYPITPETEKANEEEDAKQRAQSIDTSKTYFLKQSIGNACGTIAVLHSIYNNLGRIQLEPGSFLDRFLKASRDLSPDARAELLACPPADLDDLSRAHAIAAGEGDSTVPSATDDINLHFVAFVEVDGKLWQFDGRRGAPVFHGTTSDETLLKDSVAVVRGFIERSSNLAFNLIAFSSGTDQ